MYPIINRGTWARVQSVRQVLERFLRHYATKEDVEKIQIVSLGAGYDVSFFWIQDLIAIGALPESLRERLQFTEVDYFDVTEKKISLIKKTEALAKHIWNTHEEIKTAVDSVNEL
jgi:tRNA wybutosine-synthesizing protein 4